MSVHLAPCVALRDLLVHELWICCSHWNVRPSLPPSPYPPFSLTLAVCFPPDSVPMLPKIIFQLTICLIAFRISTVGHHHPSHTQHVRCSRWP